MTRQIAVHHPGESIPEQLPRSPVVASWNDTSRLSVELASATSSAMGSRVVMLVPKEGLIENRAILSIIGMLSVVDREVLFLGLGQKESEEDALSFLRLVTLSNKMRHVGLRARAQQVDGDDWLPALERILKTGDAVVVPDGLLRQEDGWLPRHIAPLIAARRRGPVYALTGIYKPPRALPARTLLNLLCFLIPVIFLAIQWRIIGATTGGRQTMLIAASVLVEFGLIFGLDRLTHS